VIAGEVPAMISVLSDSLPHVTSGSIRLLAVASERRVPQVPDVPTLNESGFPGYKAMSWNGLMAPAGTPKEIVDLIAGEVGRAMEDPEFVKQLRNLGADPLGNSPEEFKKMISSDIALWAEAVRVGGIKRH
jgi:tripartite-type tricarboxylate transporter receptor subunit TctC